MLPPIMNESSELSYMANSSSSSGSSNDNNNNSNSTREPSPEEWVTSVKCSTLLVIFVMTLSSNLFVLWAILVRRGSRRRSVGAGRKGTLSRVQLFMVHLSIADILVALLNILPQLAWDITVKFEGGFMLCKLVKFAQVLVLYLSTYILTGMSLDRLISMRAIYAQWQSGMRSSCSPGGVSPQPSNGSGTLGAGSKHLSRLNNHQSRIGYRKVAKLLIVLAWILSAVFALPQFFIFSYVARNASFSGNVDEHTSGQQTGSVDDQQPIAEMVRYDCLTDFSWHPNAMAIYVTSFVVIILGVPTLLMLFCYGYMCVIILRIQRGHEWDQSQMFTTTHAGTPMITGVSGGGGFAASNERLTAAKVHLVKMTFSVVLCFIVCWSPFCVAVLLRAYTLPVENAHVSPPFMVLLLLAALNSAVNPWIYAAFYANHLFKRSRRKIPSSLVNPSTQLSAARSSHHQLHADPPVIANGRQ